VVYASSPQVGVFASADGGISWQILTDQAGQAFMGRILVDPGNPDHLIAPDLQNGAVESLDGGRTWRPLGGPQVAMWVSWDPDNPVRIVAAGPTGAAVTSDGGRTWKPIAMPADGALVEMTPGQPDRLYAAALEGEAAKLWTSADGGLTWTDL
jgi:hypothetical protein